MERRSSFLPLVLMMCLAAAIVGLAAYAAQDQPQDTRKVIKHVPIQSTSLVSGKDMYTAYCAVCHGTDGKGGGPAASALKTPPSDLTVLSKNNGGKYPVLKVTAAIHGDSALPAHGSKEMPVWGALFWNLSGGHESEVQQRVANLTHYVESLQVKQTVCRAGADRARAGRGTSVSLCPPLLRRRSDNSSESRQSA
jgi:mono/diheme cytochrome c family protein